jgi:hypothetical protein
MANANGRELQFLIAGGGIAGIQLGPHIFRTLEQIGLKDTVLAGAR